ncbi:hypothetical protein A3J33_02285 [candidate division WWE3 bacterium RIFCSPLOWO2_02_FULL_53_10]|uniref:Uncharacterized protein n=1 Tax=candidate division WWE3 bacterium RIFCSPLOWO2_02_FULL_53_10 TaxID=1802629 RepID=A0A1F4WBF5_UNCKA|nr:MAG: hypothetical protein A3J33_02285 [candidate division WWE3 bacterium RIFCSPLOWO2_02_FULL_53_10]
MLKRILKSKWFWVATLVLVGGAWLYLSRNPGLIEDLKSSLNTPPNLSEDFNISDVIQYEDTTDWKFERDPVVAGIISIDPKDQKMGLNFILPTGFITERFGENEESTLTIKIGCTNEESSFYVATVPKDYQTGDPLEPKLQETGIDIFAKALDGDSIIGLCANQDCTEINRSCQLYRIIATEE